MRALLFATALLVVAATLLFGSAHALLHLLAGPAFGVLTRRLDRLGLAPAVVLFQADAVLLEVHQLLQGEQDGALFLLGHGVLVGTFSQTNRLASELDRKRSLRLRTS